VHRATDRTRRQGLAGTRAKNGAVATAVLFHRDHAEEVQDWKALADHVGRRRILWVDLDRPSVDELREVVDVLQLDNTTAEKFESEDGKPFFEEFDSYLHTTAFVPADDTQRAKLVKVTCLVAERWIVTVHETPVQVLEQFRDRVRGSGQVGLMDGPQFLADLLDWVLAAYMSAFEAIELALEEFDTKTMTGDHDDAEEELERLVQVRREVGRLRRALVSHRELFLALSHPELDAITDSKHAERFTSLRRDLESAVQSARDSRDSVVGSFDVLVARTGQRTNEIMKILTLGSMLLLPGAVIAGVMGMNFKIGLFDTDAYFWVVCGVIVALAGATLVAARTQRWI
jgi:magnesium transporter